jgi:hypothetical protein
MAPFRPDHPTWYSWLAVLGSSIACSVLAVVIAINVNAKSAERDRAQQEELRSTLCSFVVALDDANRAAEQAGQPPTSLYGTQLAERIRTGRQVLSCPDGPPAPIPTHSPR